MSIQSNKTPTPGNAPDQAKERPQPNTGRHWQRQYVIARAHRIELEPKEVR